MPSSSQFGRFLARSMDLIAKERPSAFERLNDALGGLRVRLAIDGVAVHPRFTAAGFELAEDAPDPHVDLESDRAAILEVADGRLTLEDAVWNERIVLRGGLRDLVAFHDALAIYLQGAVRCPSFPTLLDAYRSEGSTSG